MFEGRPALNKNSMNLVPLPHMTRVLENPAIHWYSVFDFWKAKFGMGQMWQHRIRDNLSPDVCYVLSLSFIFGFSL